MIPKCLSGSDRNQCPDDPEIRNSGRLNRNTLLGVSITPNEEVFNDRRQRRKFSTDFEREVTSLVIDQVYNFSKAFLAVDVHENTPPYLSKLHYR